VILCWYDDKLRHFCRAKQVIINFDYAQIQMPKTIQKISAYDKFLSAIHSPMTKVEYVRKLDNYAKYFNIKSWDKYVKRNSDAIHEELEVYIAELKKRGVRNHSIKNALNPVLLLLKMNRVATHDKILKTQLRRDGKTTAGHEPYKTEEIQLMLDVTKELRSKALVHFWASTGCRPASVIDPVLRLKHLVEMPHDCTAMKIYDESDQGYWAFLTPEATKILRHYLQSRKINGEKLDDESPVFINSHDSHGTRGEPITIRSVREIMYRIIRKAGVQRIKIGPRYDKAAIYAFRHRFNKILKINNSVNSNIAEKLMAHKKGLDGVYLNPTREECFAEFVKAIPELTINRQAKLQLENELQQEKIIETEALRKQVRDLESRIDEMDKQKIESLIDVKSEKFKSLEDKISELVKNHEHLSAFIATDPEYYKRFILDEKKRLDEKEKSDNKQN